VWTQCEKWTQSDLPDSEYSTLVQAPAAIDLSISDEDVELEWSEVTGAQEYLIFRTNMGSGFDFNDPLETVEPTGSGSITWKDVDANSSSEENFSTSYLYVVRAVDSNGLMENNFHIVGKISHVLQAGRNWVRWNGEGGISCEDVFASLGTGADAEYNTVQSWNATTSTYDVYYSHPLFQTVFGNDFDTISNDQGYFIDVKTPEAPVVWSYVIQ